MLSSGANLIWTQDNKRCHFICDNETSLDIAQEALNQFQAYIVQLKAQAKAKAEEQAKESADNKVEAIKEVSDVQSGT